MVYLDLEVRWDQTDSMVQSGRKETLVIGDLLESLDLTVLYTYFLVCPPATTPTHHLIYETLGTILLAI